MEGYLMHIICHTCRHVIRWNQRKGQRLAGQLCPNCSARSYDQLCRCTFIGDHPLHPGLTFKGDRGPTFWGYYTKGGLQFVETEKGSLEKACQLHEIFFYEYYTGNILHKTNRERFRPAMPTVPPVNRSTYNNTGTSYQSLLDKYGV